MLKMLPIILCGLLFADCAHTINHVAGLKINYMTVDGSWRFTTFSGGLHPLLGVPSYGVKEVLTDVSLVLGLWPFEVV
jgi:hypothetical protein